MTMSPRVNCTKPVSARTALDVACSLYRSGCTGQFNSCFVLLLHGLPSHLLFLVSNSLDFRTSPFYFISICFVVVFVFGGGGGGVCMCVCVCVWARVWVCVRACVCVCVICLLRLEQQSRNAAGNRRNYSNLIYCYQRILLSCGNRPHTGHDRWHAPHVPTWFQLNAKRTQTRTTRVATETV